MDANSDIRSKIKNMLVERLMLDIPPEQIDDAEDLTETYDLDSVRLFELVIGTEEEFGISFEDDEFSPEKFSTVNTIAEVIREKLS
jgi:acyl carrier protein